MSILALENDMTVSRPKHADWNEAKKKLRARLLRILSALSVEEVKRRTLGVEDRLRALDHFKKAKVVMMFWPLRGEVDVRGLIRRVQEEGKKVALPVISGQDIEPFEFTDEAGLVINSFGVAEPSPAQARRIPLDEVDLVLVPGLAFDRKGNRLGRGGGYYDRFLARLPETACTVGICFEPQIQEDLPVIPHLDRAVRFVVSA